MKQSLRFATRVWNRNWIDFKHHWFGSLFWIFVEPILLLLALGFGLGGFISNINGIPYLDFFFPAVIMNATMFVAFFLSTYDNFAKLSESKVFLAQLRSSLEVKDILHGELLWILSKVLLCGFVLSFIGFFIGIHSMEKLFGIFLFVTLDGLVFGLFGIWILSIVRSQDQFIYPTVGLLVPMSLFCGSYFPIEQLPFFLKGFLWLFPQTHAIMALRTFLQQGFVFAHVFNILFLVFCIFLLYRLALKSLRDRLIE